MTFMSRKKKYGEQANKATNRHRSHFTLIQPLEYPEEVNSWTVPKEAREELKAKVRKAHQETCSTAMLAFLEHQRQLKEALEAELEKDDG